MKLILTESQYKIIIRESINDEYDYYELLNQLTYDIFLDIRNKKKIIIYKINPIQYKTALSEFVKYGEFFRFPSQIVYKWKNICLRNTLILKIMNDMYGHSTSFPFDEFYDVFEIPEEEHDYKWDVAIDILGDKYNIEEYTPKFSNGHELISDYGMEPLLKLAFELVKQDNPNEIIVTINKMLDISHQRSDLSELFIEGGGGALDMITNN
jgi:hypothetical protein